MIGRCKRLSKILLPYLPFIMFNMNMLCILKVKALQARLTIAEMEIVEYKVEIEHLRYYLVPCNLNFVDLLLRAVKSNVSAVTE